MGTWVQIIYCGFSGNNIFNIIMMILNHKAV